MNLAVRKLLGVGLISLGASFSSANTTNARSDIQAPTDWGNGNGGCGDGEQAMQIKTARPPAWFDEYTITWRQLSDGCRSPVVDGFEATGYFKTADVDEQGRELSILSPDEDASPKLSVDMCAPYGYYELEIKVGGKNVNNHDKSLDIRWQIDAASDENLMVTKWSGKAELSKQSKPPSAWYIPNLRYGPTQSLYVWPVKNEAGYQQENMWSGREPQVCTTSGEFGSETDYSNEVPVLDTFDEGCYDYFDNKDIFAVIGDPSPDMTTEKCKYMCQKEGYGYSATANGENCLCGDMPPRYKRALDDCNVPCPGDSKFVCGGNRSNWYLSVIKIPVADTLEATGAEARRMIAVPKTPVVPETPAIPYTPAVPFTPAVPAKPAVPGTPLIPGTPAVPGSPFIPAIPGTCGMPAIPGIVGIPAVPAVPGSPQIPGTDFVQAIAAVPGKPAVSGKPAVPGKLAVPAQAAIPGKPFVQAIPAVPEVLAVQWSPRVPAMQALPAIAACDCSQFTPAVPAVPDTPAVPDQKEILAEPATMDVAAVPGTPFQQAVPARYEKGQLVSDFIPAVEAVPGTPFIPGTPAVAYRPPIKGTPFKKGTPFVQAIPAQCSTPFIPARPFIPETPEVEEVAGVPGTPFVPAKPGTCATPAIPGTAEILAQPAVPAVPAVPGTPFIPAIAGTCSTPAIPGSPMIPAVPAVPAIPAVPGTAFVQAIAAAPGKPAVPDTAAVPGTPAVPATPAIPGRPAVPGTPANTYKGCYSIEENAGVFPKHADCGHLMSNKVCLRECHRRGYWYSATTMGTECYCGDQAPVWRMSDQLCNLPCEDDSDTKCGDQKFLTVFLIHPSPPSVPLPAPLPLPPTVTNGGVTPKGCYSFKENSGIFTKEVKSSELMSNEVCQRNCRKINYWYSATTEGKKCYCGDKAPVWRMSDSLCSLQCEDGSFTKCGDWGFYSVFGINKPISPLPPTVTDGGVTPKGCYGFKENSGIFTVKVKSSELMSNKVCQRKCREIQYWYSATTEGKECYCGDKAPVSRMSDSLCSLQCEDGSDPKCGDWGFYTVFQIHKPTSKPRPPTDAHGVVTPKGCYGFKENSGIFTKAVKTSELMSNEVCQRKCREINYWYSATTEGKECYCGDKAPVWRMSDSLCSLQCQDGSDTKCGDWGFYTVFHMKKPVSIIPPSEPWPPTDTDGGVKYKGCYGIQDNSRIFTKELERSQWMSNELCQRKCREIEYWYSATTEGTACYCGDKPPIHRRDDWRCDLPCEDGSDIKCGGWGFYTVFQLHKPLPPPALSYGEVEGSHAKGCFEDSTYDRVLGGHSFDSDSMTSQKCGQVCKEKHYKVFGVEFGRECFCGNKVPSADRKADKCDKRCTGNAKEVCGGHSRINIYEFGGGYHDSSLKDDEVDGAQTLGCYEDDKNKRVLNGHSFDDKTGMTAKKCGHECDRRGYKVFGTEFGRECFCGHDVPDTNWRADKCDSQCAGNPWVACGGHSRINVFKWVNGYDSGPDHNVPYHGVLHPDTYYGASALGCFKDSKRDRVLDDNSKADKHMSAKVCGDFCKSEGYAFFGTQYSTECFCGNYFKKKDKVDDDDCDYACPGEPSASCGGNSRINVYEFTGHSYAEDDRELVKPELGNMLGCFKDTKHNRILSLKAEYKLDNMTPEKCYLHCKLVHDAMYYGVEFGKECFCGSRDSKYDDHPLGGDSCMMPCPGDDKRYCGGRDAMNVYGPRKNH